MDGFTKLTRSATLYSITAFLLVISLAVLLWRAGTELLALPEAESVAGAGIIALLAMPFIANVLSKIILSPLKAVWLAVIRLSPDHSDTPRPRYDQLIIGKDLAENMGTQIYQHASKSNEGDLIEHRRAISQAANVVSHMPTPLFVFNKDLLVTNASDSAMEYCGVESSQLFGKPIFENLYLDFPTDNTLESWIDECRKNRVTHTGYWERVRVRPKSGSTYHQCDMSAFYNRENPGGAEYIVTLFDRTGAYNQDDEALSFVSLAVHELRTPLTMLRGYIEALQEDLGDDLNDELRGYLRNMEASSAQLTSFVRNILNVTKIENNQLEFNLVEENWGAVLSEIVDELRLRASISGKEIELNIDPDLPTVGIDRVSIYEVVANLVDNAIKYSLDPERSKKIVVSAHYNQEEGKVETTVQDFGVGIQASVIPNLFSRFYRNHRTKGKVNGSGLGLYLCKALVTAHGGQIWAKSHEDEGTTIGFTLVPFSELAADQRGSDDEGGMIRQANGWIKNHSYYRLQ